MWFGGKGNLVKKLLQYVPPHDAYLEPFFGGGSLFFAKRPSRIEVINDIDRDLMNFYSVLRDEEKFARFYRLAYLTPYSRCEYKRALEKFKRKEWRDDVERAYLFFVIARMSFSGNFGGSWSYAITEVRKEMSGSVSKYLSAIDMLPEVHERLRYAQIECDDWLSVWQRYIPLWKERKFRVFAYLDPPYVSFTRREGEYRHEFTAREYVKLIDVIKDEMDVQIMLSGYPSRIHERLEECGWRRVCWNVACWAVGKTHEAGLVGEGITEEKGQRRTECIWMNYSVEGRQTKLL
ncbi:MAG: hypothetical protein EJNHJLOP_00047 [Methanophagales virus PBV082]|uniref:site-specific DNA-methyltransferase (adenine-specific) n=1 Tax=Methanophagales virus PBV082 TaxID=3071307 RepID=A0AA46TDP6_9VIRU|nr:MAG: hypothetical protein QIT52_gp47 [Methanophagales virus PBV082]UYL64936.1 MAG: hypothetical protein EJNHJLOP_00047 [Methanophagales virus PBV082]